MNQLTDQKQYTYIDASEIPHSEKKFVQFYVNVKDCRNPGGNPVIAADAEENGALVSLQVYEDHREHCGDIAPGNRIIVYGRIMGPSKFSGHKKRGGVWSIACHETKLIRRNELQEKLNIEKSNEGATDKKTNWTKMGGYEPEELLFLRVARVADDHVLVHQYEVLGGQYRVDFMVIRRRDGVPVQAFEIDGAHHKNNVMDDVRTRRIREALKIDVHRYTNEEVRMMAREAGYKF